MKQIKNLVWGQCAEALATQLCCQVTILLCF
jgi:hypothetical protein